MSALRTASVQHRRNSLCLGRDNHCESNLCPKNCPFPIDPPFGSRCPTEALPMRVAMKVSADCGDGRPRAGAWVRNPTDDLRNRLGGSRQNALKMSNAP